jgi:hypothetical protein
MAFQMYKGDRQRNILLSMHVGDVAYFNCSYTMLWYRLKKATKHGFVYKWAKCINGGYCIECVQDTIDKLPTSPNTRNTQ